MQIKRSLSIYLGIYLSILLTCNAFLGLFFPKMILRIIYILLIAVILLFQIIKKNMIISMSKMDIMISGYIIYSMLRILAQIILGDVSTATNISFFQTVIPVFMYFIAKKIDGESSRKIEIWLGFFGTLSVALGLVDRIYKILPAVGAFKNDLYASVGGGAVVTRGYSLAGSALVTGYICIIAIMFMLPIKVKTKYAYWGKVVGVIILAIGLAATLSRGAFFSLIIAMMVLYSSKINVWMSKISKRKFVMFFCAIFILAILVMVNVEKIMDSTIYKRLFDVGFSILDSSNSNRINFQTSALAAIKEYFLFGKGFGFVGVQALSANVIGGVNTESYFLSLIVNGGIIYFILFLVIVVYATLKKNKDIDKKYVSVVIAITVWSITYIPLDSDLNAAFFWYCIGRIFSVNTSV